VTYQICCWVAGDQHLDTVEVSTSSEAEKGAAHKAEAGDVEAPDEHPSRGGR
jgi:hypothetical protein